MSLIVPGGRRVAMFAAALMVAFATNLLAVQANLTIYVFSESQPVEGVELFVDGGLVSTTDGNGVAVLQIDPGIRNLEMRLQDRVVLNQPILAHEDEISQWIVNVPERGSTTLVDIESSAAGGAVAAGAVGAAAVTLEPDGAPGTISGTLRSAEDDRPISGARIYISGQASEIRTGEDGRFTAEITEGTYSISVLHSGFNTLTRDGILVVGNESTEVNLELTPAGSELPEFLVVEPYIAGSLASVLEERREELAVANILGSEQISKAGDSNAASALRRVTGLTLVGGKFIYVRGLGERYSSTLVNGANVPSPDATRRVVPLDLFPAGIIDSISVQKGYTPDLPGEFGGGTVQLRTKSVPESSFFTISASMQYNSQTTFDDALTYKGGGDDWIGFDDGTRAVPDVMCDAICDGSRLVEFNRFTGIGFTKGELEEIGESLPVNYDITTKTAPPNLGLGIAGGGRYDLSNDWRLGFLAAVDYGNDWLTVSQRRRSFAASDAEDLITRTSFTHDISVNQIDLSGFFTTGLEFSDTQKLSWNWMLLRQTDDVSRIEQGFDIDVDEGDVLFRELRWTERALESQQFIGEHIFPAAWDLKIDWQFTESTAETEEPDLRRYRYDPDPQADEETDPFPFIFSLRNDGNVRSWSELQDDAKSWSVDVMQPLKFFDSVDLAIMGGLSDVEQDREFGLRRFAFRSRGSVSGNSDLRRNPSVDFIIFDETIDPRGWQIVETTIATDAYTAEQEIVAHYVNAEVSIPDRARFSFGFREESSDQTVVTFDPFSPTNDPVIADLSTDDRFPALTATFFFGGHQLRANYGETINRPDFKELSPALYRDPVLDRLVKGNPDLLPGFLTHYDLRWDYYFNPGEFISLGIFYKDMDQPIESVVVPGAAILTSFDNAESAENKGVEFELYHNLGVLDFADDWWGWNTRPWLEKMYVNTNYAWIDSEVTIPEGSIQTNETRPLQGQSDYVWNFQLGYDDDEQGINAALLYNIVGERIVDVGVSGAPDIVEQPRGVLDFVYAQEIGQSGEWKFKFKAQNLLNSEIEILQGNETWRQFTVGRFFQIEFEWSPEGVFWDQAD